MRLIYSFIFLVVVSFAQESFASRVSLLSEEDLFSPTVRVTVTYRDKDRIIEGNFSGVYIGKNDDDDPVVLTAAHGVEGLKGKQIRDFRVRARNSTYTVTGYEMFRDYATDSDFKNDFAKLRLEKEISGVRPATYDLSEETFEDDLEAARAGHAVLTGYTRGYDSLRKGRAYNVLSQNETYGDGFKKLLFSSVENGEKEREGEMLGENGMSGGGVYVLDESSASSAPRLIGLHLGTYDAHVNVFANLASYRNFIASSFSPENGFVPVLLQSSNPRTRIYARQPMTTLITPALHRSSVAPDTWMKTVSPFLIGLIDLEEEKESLSTIPPLFKEGEYLKKIIKSSLPLSTKGFFNSTARYYAHFANTSSWLTTSLLRQGRKEISTEKLTMDIYTDEILGKALKLPTYEMSEGPSKGAEVNAESKESDEGFRSDLETEFPEYELDSSTDDSSDLPADIKKVLENWRDLIQSNGRTLIDLMDSSKGRVLMSRDLA